MCTHTETHTTCKQSHIPRCIPFLHPYLGFSASFSWIWVLEVLFLLSEEAELLSPKGTQQGKASCPVNFLWLWALETAPCVSSSVWASRRALYLRSRASHGGGGTRGLEDGVSTMKRVGGAWPYRMQLPSVGRAHRLLLPIPLALPALCAQGGFMY